MESKGAGVLPPRLIRRETARLRRSARQFVSFLLRHKVLWLLPLTLAGLVLLVLLWLDSRTVLSPFMYRDY